MGRRPPVLPLALLLATLLATPAHAGQVHLSPDPLPTGHALTVRATFDEAVEEATLRACHADDEGTVDYCLRSQAMTRTGDGAWTATTPRGFPTEGQAGANVTATTGDGTVLHLPDDGSAYVFVPLTDATATTPLPGPLALVLVLAAAVLAGRRWTS